MSNNSRNIILGATAPRKWQILLRCNDINPVLLAQRRSAHQGQAAAMRDTVYCVLCVVVTLMLGALAARYVSGIWILAFFESLQTHLGLACAAGALLALLVRRHWYAMLLLAVSALLVGHSIVMLREHAVPAATTDAQPSFRLVSFNIDTDNFENGERIGDFIVGSKADVIVISEASPLLSQMSRLLEIYPYRVGCGALVEDCDSLLMSKRPFLTENIRSLGSLWDNRFIMVTIDMDGQPVTFAAAHLSKPYFDDFHRGELDILQQILNLAKGPLLLTGDFNASVIEPDMRHFLTMTSLRHVFPEPATWPIEAGAFGISIDHVFGRAPLLLKSVQQIPDSMGSNHYGLISDFTVAK
jgi:endonuclease/exonuclease/phosphatase (EEP) superfamily protein YafD